MGCRNQLTVDRFLGISKLIGSPSPHIVSVNLSQSRQVLKEGKEFQGHLVSSRELEYDV